ncbi:hypothetical protein [Actinocatenispora rupis]|uniref:Integral membrane protein n=1 Tax=Actinocatenispora rupis TaxID=519421 RepID=A0A8J3JEV0_9ACTN|nr:hypothetical protein [Actinocatenispora rupis]GID15162.1 hypothetical protein Aru02nite_60510 [Actinocatenispora rupis]
MTEPEHRVLPATLKVALGLLWAEGVALLGLGIWLAVASLVGNPTDRTASLVEAAVTIVLGLGLGLFGVVMFRGRSWARGPSIVLQLMLLAVGYFMITAGVVWAGVLVIALGLGVAGLLIAPASRESLGIR